MMRYDFWLLESQDSVVLADAKVHPKAESGCKFILQMQLYVCSCLLLSKAPSQSSRPVVIMLVAWLPFRRTISSHQSSKARD